MSDAARERARRHGRDTFMTEVVERWPACVTCGEVIRRSAHIDRPGMYRLCGCQGIVWRSRAIIGEPWERLVEDEL